MSAEKIRVEFELSFYDSSLLTSLYDPSLSFVCAIVLDLHNGHAFASECSVCNKGFRTGGRELCCHSVFFVMPLLTWLSVLQLLRNIRMYLCKRCHGEELRRRGHEHLVVQSFQMLTALRSAFFLHA